MWPDWAIFCTLGNHSKQGANIILPKLPTLLGNFCKGVKTIHFSIEIIFGQLLYTFGDFYLVTCFQPIFPSTVRIRGSILKNSCHFPNSDLLLNSIPHFILFSKLTWCDPTTVRPTDLGEILPFLGTFYMSLAIHLVLGKILNILWYIFVILGKIT